MVSYKIYINYIKLNGHLLGCASIRTGQQQSYRALLMGNSQRQN
jgi:hypothetical protein